MCAGVSSDSIEQFVRLSSVSIQRFQDTSNQTLTTSVVENLVS